MKPATILPLFVLTLALCLTGCFNSTGQDSDYVADESVQERTTKETRTRRSGDDDWSEHRKNFGDRRTTSSRSDSDRDSDADWGGDYDNSSDWDNEEFERNMDELRKELDGLVDLDELERQLKSAEREYDERGYDEDLAGLEEAFESLGEALSEVGNAISDGVQVSSVDYDELKDVLPSRIRGYDKKNFNGDKVSVFGFNLSVFEQEYVSERNQDELNITLIDLGSLANAAVAGLDWLDLEIKSESSTGFEQTTTIDGYPAFEECERSSCSLVVVVEDRFVVNIESNDMDTKDLRNVLDKVDIKKLADMNEDGR